MWKVTTTNEYDRWLGNQNEEVVTEVIAVVRLLRQYGPGLSRPHADTLNDSRFANMKELRVRTPRLKSVSPLLLIQFARPYCLSPATNAA